MSALSSKENVIFIDDCFIGNFLADCDFASSHETMKLFKQEAKPSLLIFDLFSCIFRGDLITLCVICDFHSTSGHILFFFVPDQDSCVRSDKTTFNV